MVEASKLLFDRGCKDCECSELIHPWTHKCSDATTTMLLSCIKGSYKFYAMVYLVSIKYADNNITYLEVSFVMFRMYMYV